jgi:hypothetical protein
VCSLAGYNTVNREWPDPPPPPPTAQEAIAAARRLYRKFVGHPWRGEWRATSGNRYTWPRRGVYAVNPDKRESIGGGWQALVHDMSHYINDRVVNRKHNGHGVWHATLEREMIAYVIASGWLDGKLRSKATAKAKPPIQDVRRARVEARIVAWERKQKRAETALRKLYQQRRYYERQAAVR